MLRDNGKFILKILLSILNFVVYVTLKVTNDLSVDQTLNHKKGKVVKELTVVLTHQAFSLQ